MTLVVDAGRTHCRVRLLSGGAHRDATVPSRATLADRDGPQRIQVAITEASAALATAGQLGTGPLAVAVAGALTRPAAAAALAERLARGWSGPVLVTSDVVAAHAAALGGRPGVVLAAGTGAVALALGEDGGWALVDGGGYLAGDAGSGFAIGRAGLAAALRYADGRPGGSAALARAAQARYSVRTAAARTEPPAGTGTGVDPVRAALAAVHAAPDPARQVASFAPDVAAVARAGDPFAAGIWRAAASELAASVTAALTRQPSDEVTLVGALFDVGDLLTGPLVAAVAATHPAVSVRVAAADALAGAAWLAVHATDQDQSPARSYLPLLVRPGGPTRPREENVNPEEG